MNAKFPSPARLFRRRRDANGAAPGEDPPAAGPDAEAPPGAENGAEDAAAEPAAAKERPAATALADAGVRFEDGERNITDLIAPGSIEERSDRVSVDGRASRVHSLDSYPRAVYPNWLSPLLDGDEPIDFSLHVTPIPQREAARTLRRRLVQFESSRRMRMRRGSIGDYSDDIAYADIEALRAGLERGDERLFQVGAYMRVYGSTPENLDAASERAEMALGALLAGARPARFEQRFGLLTCLPAAQDYLRIVRNIDTSSLSTMLPFASSQSGDRQGILYGTQLGSSSLVVLDPFGRPNANKVVFAASGSGKSYACKIEAMRALLAGASYFVIDPEGEYEPLVEAMDGATIRMSGSSSARINPFDLPPAGEGGEDQDPLAQQVLSLQGLFGIMLAAPGERLGPGEAGALDAAIYRAYERAGITSNPATHGEQPPILADLLAVLREGDDPYSLGDRLERYATGSLGRIFSAPTTVDLDNPFVVFDVRDLEHETMPLAIYVIAQHVWRDVRMRPRPRLLLIDEAWTLMRYPAGAQFIERMVRQARKHWLGLITITQDVNDFLGCDEGRTVLANSALKLLLRQDPAVIEAVASTFTLSPPERDFLLAAGPGRGLLIAGNERIPIGIDASRFEHEIATTNPLERGQ